VLDLVEPPRIFRAERNEKVGLAQGGVPQGELGSARAVKVLTAGGREE